MARVAGIGKQDFEKVRVSNNFYVDKTHFIREWWEAEDDVTLITRPRRFGKTLNMSMLEKFFSVEYAGRGDLFEGLSIWEEEKYRRLQGTYPVVFLSFASVKETNYVSARRKICQLIADEYSKRAFLLEEGGLLEEEKEKEHSLKQYLRHKTDQQQSDEPFPYGRGRHFFCAGYDPAAEQCCKHYEQREIIEIPPQEAGHFRVRHKDHKSRCQAAYG